MADHEADVLPVFVFVGFAEVEFEARFRGGFGERGVIDGDDAGGRNAIDDLVGDDGNAVDDGSGIRARIIRKQIEDRIEAAIGVKRARIHERQRFAVAGGRQIFARGAHGVRVIATRFGETNLDCGTIDHVHAGVGGNRRGVGIPDFDGDVWFNV